MKIGEITKVLTELAPSAYQESYDNTGLLVGNPLEDCRGVICTLDATEEVVLEAVAKNCNLVVAHHPILFSGLKKLNGNNYVERALIAAIKKDVAIYAIHTNLDNVLSGVNARIADKLGLINRQILLKKPGTLIKLATYVPENNANEVRDALFRAGAGNIGNYSECSFNIYGKGTYKAGEGAHPFAGAIGTRHEEDEVKVEVVFPSYLEDTIVKLLLEAHPYEEVAYDLFPLVNTHTSVGSGLIGDLTSPMEETAFLKMLKDNFHLKAIRHTPLLHKPLLKVAVCGGAGSFLIKKAIAAGADIYITADIKYHEFFDADGRLVLADIGHFESEQFTIDLLCDVLQSKFPNFALLKSETPTNPVSYYF